jgi:hypothetical protein
LQGIAFQRQQHTGGVVGGIAGYYGYIGTYQFIKQVMGKAYLLMFQHQHAYIFYRYGFIRLVLHATYMPVAYNQLLIAKV